MNDFSRKTVTAIELPETFAAALLVIAGKYGIGQTRADALTAAGYDYNRVQKCVNDLVKVVEKYG